MSKSIKLKDNNFIDSRGIVHNKKLLYDLLTSINNKLIEIENNNEWKYYDLASNPIIRNTERTINMDYKATEIALYCWNESASWQSYCLITLPLMYGRTSWTTGLTKNSEAYKIGVNRNASNGIYITCGYEQNANLKIIGFYYR